MIGLPQCKAAFVLLEFTADLEVSGFLKVRSYM